MKKQSLKFVQMMIVLALLVSSIGTVAAAPSQRAVSDTLSVETTADSADAASIRRPNRLVQLRTPRARERSQPLDVVSSANLASLGWTTVFTDSFESFPADWALYTGTLDQEWDSTAHMADDEYNPASTMSVWSAAGGADAVDPASGNYPNDLESWMIRGPIDLSAWKMAEIDFSANYDIEEGDWLGVCAASFATAPVPADFDQDQNCSWLTGTTEGWEYDYLDLSGYVGSSDVYIAFVFQSDGSNAEDYAGPFIDELELWANDVKVDPTDPNNEFVDWTELVYQPFDDVALESDALWKLEATPASSLWMTTTVANDDFNPLSTTSVSPTPDESYAAGVQSWMYYGPVDLSEQVEADFSYSVVYDLIYNDDEDAGNDDWLAVCAFAADKALADVSPDDVQFDNCEWWSGSSENYWEEGFFDISAFAGRSQVYLAWYFESNNANADGGVFVDELSIEAQSASAVVPPPVDFESSGLELTNGDFANGLTGWSKETPAGKSGDVSVIDGRAAMTGNQRLLHDFTVADQTIELNIYFDFAVETTEFDADNDGFCVHLAPTGDHEEVLADVGCWDVSQLSEFTRDGTTMETFGYGIPQDQIPTLRGQSVTLVVELTQNDSDPTTLYLDDMVVYGLSEAPRGPGVRAASAAAVNDVATTRDANEPNNFNTNATPLACNQSKSGVFGDVAGTTNKDWDVFKMDRVPVGQLIVDVDAATLQPASSADTLVQLLDSSFTKIADYDDDGATTDSKLVYDNTTANATYYVALYNYNADGAGAFYTMNAKCGQSAAPPAPAPLTPPAPPAGVNRAWTIMLYMNGEDQSCVKSSSPTSCWDKATYEKAVKEIEKFIGSKLAVMNVVVLIDGPNYGGVAKDVTRYVVQPNGAYTEGVNKWSLDEINMGDPKTLVDFADWAMANYPADHYYLAIDDHGGGADGTSWDHHNVGGAAIDDQITPAELRSAMKQITRSGQRKLDIFAFESCLMGLFENAYDLKDYANYIAAFQSISWTTLQYPAYFRDLSATDSVEQVAKRIVQRYPVASTNTPYTFSMYKSSKLNDVKTRLDAFATALMGADLATLNTIRNATQAFRGNPMKGDASTDSFGNLDLWDFARRVKAAGIAANEATALQAAIEAAVIEKKAVLKGRTPVWDYSNYHGLSIIYPNYASTKLDTYCRDYSLSDHGAGAWSKFLTDKVWTGYTWNCGSSSAATQAASLQATGLRLQHSSIQLEPRPRADEQGSSIYLPIITK